MPYRYVENLSISDVAFEAWGESLDEMFAAAATAVMNLMISDLTAVRECTERKFSMEDPQLDMLLFQVLQEFIYYKDAERLLLKAKVLQVRPEGGAWIAHVESAGEPINPQRHGLLVDVKAVTLHNLSVKEIPQGWNATVVVDV